MKFTLLYRGSVYLMLALSTLVMSVDAGTYNRLSMMYPFIVGIAGALALVTVDRSPGKGLSRPMAYALWGVSTGLIYIEYKLTGQILLALAHWLVYLQLIKTSMPKTVEDDWLLFAVGVMQVLVGTVMSQSDAIGLTLFAWALSALWVLGLFYLHREAQAHRGDPKAPLPEVGVCYAGLIDGPFLFASLRVVAITVALGSVIFLAMPRHTVVGMSPKRGVAAKHLTGFDEEIQLGQLGEILENDSVVMSIELFDGSRNRIELPREPLWRGITMGRYENGRWHRIPVRSKELSSAPTRGIPPDEIVLQRIKLEPTDTKALFGLRPILDVATRERVQPQINQRDGSLSREDVRQGTYDYDVLSAANPKLLQKFELYPDEDRLALVKVPEPLKGRLQKLAQQIVADVPDSNFAERAKVLEGYLKDSGRFTYTLQMDVVDESLDPVEDFLINRKEGHCAYYASALTLMLRSIGIPARMVNGFKGGDWNELTSVLTVRQKHAHSWVEALIGKDGSPNSPLPVWLALDPTPGEARDQTVAKIGGVSPNVRLLSDFIRYVWVFYIAGFDSERQDRLVYMPIRALMAEVRKGYEIVADGISGAVATLLHFPDVASFFSVRGFFVSFFALLLLVGLYGLLSRLTRRLLRWFRGPENDLSALSAGVGFYRRLAQLLSECGLERPPAETPHEFARRASGFLIGRGTHPEPVSEVPAQVVDAFYHVRFGHRELLPEELQRLEQRLDALQASLNEG
jgi:transglutaminase-like putative cysteine protease